jgi:hypothetical protein
MNLKKLLNRLGYELKRVGPNVSRSEGFTLYRYLNDNGSFDYEAYKQSQIEGNKRKINNIWVQEDNIIFLSNYILNIINKPKFGICHGTRTGKEQQWFRNYLNCEVIGTEISDTAGDYPYTIQWDFHEAKVEWLDSVDFIYSNSFDHSYDPEKCLNIWMSCVKKGGICILEHSQAHGPAGVSPTDPFGADIVLMPYLILTWGKGNFGIRELLKSPSKNEVVGESYFIVIQRF